MKYTVKLNQKIYEVEIEKAGTSTQPAPAAFQPTAAPQPPISQPAIPQSTATPPSPAPTPSTGAGDTEIECPMPGKILSITAAVGQRVSAGQCLMVLEAMKMENEMVAPRNGTVKQILVSQGTMVNTGDVLAVLI